jgi:hypothetical protein
MSFELGTNNTATALAAMSPESVRILWQKTVDIFEQTEDFFMQFEGTNKDSPIFVINDTAAGKGLKLRITSRAGYYGPGKSGDNLFNLASDFETDVINSMEVDVDYLRDAVSITERTDEYMGMQSELAFGQAGELGKWMGREKTARIMMTYRLKGGPQNTLISGGHPTVDGIKSSDGLTYNDILYMGQVLKPLGGAPCETATIRGVPVLKYCIVGVTPGLFTLKQDPDYKLILKDAMPREKYDQNPLFSGGYAELDGHSIREYNPIDHDGYGPVGSAFNPKAFLGGAIAAGTAAFNILGGGSAAAASLTNIQYFRFFSEWAFEFLPNDVYTPLGLQNYILIVNPKNAAVDPGKIGMYGYTVNSGNTLTINQRLAPVTNGPVALSQVGNVTWNTGVWSTANGGPGHTNVHPIGSTILECNANGVPYGRTVMFGARNIIRGYGKFRNKRTQWMVDGEFETRKYITSVFGQSLRKNVNNVYPGYVQLLHSLSYPELGLPVVV